MSITIPTDKLGAVIELLGARKAKQFADLLGYETPEALLAVSAGDPATIWAGSLQDWRTPEDVQADATELAADSAIMDFSPSPIVIQQSEGAIDVFIGGAEKDYTLETAASVRIEREKGRTRFMIYDSLCDAPRVFAIAKASPIVELANDWEPTRVE